MHKDHLQAELELARAYEQANSFEGLNEEQLNLIMNRGRALYKWFKAHPYIHNLISLLVIVFILSADYFILMRLPAWFLEAGRATGWGPALLTALLAAGLHSWLFYSLTVFTLHEGSAHKMIFPPRGPVSSVANFLANNLARLAGAEPGYYAEHHMTHHSKFGTKEDGEFLNFVIPRRYWMTFLPLATIFNFSDFIIHRPLAYTTGRMVSGLTTATYHGLYGLAVYQRFGLVFALSALAFFPHVGFYFDRLRQYSEHNLMPLDNKNGARSFGLGFWGLVVGGGPWGQPCHWEHHLVASVPWYQQLMLHRYVVTLLTPRQRKQFLIEPITGFPKLWWRLLRESNAFLQRPLRMTAAGSRGPAGSPQCPPSQRA